LKVAIGILGISLILAEIGNAQASGNSNAPAAEASAAAREVPTDSYAVFDATPAQEAALRAQIRLMHPEVLPLRVFFVPHWKYLDNARIFHLHVPTGYGSLMFTHLPSRTVFIDNDRYQDESWLGYWIAHELGHLATNSAKEGDAEKAAREFRRRLKDARQ
jgi:hypothetical protein